MDELDFDRIGNKIRQRRREVHTTQEALAEKLDVNPSHISNIECGRAKPSLTMLVRIAEVLQCPIDVFLSEEYAPFQKKKTASLSELEQISAALHGMPPEKREQLLRIIRVL